MTRKNGFSLLEVMIALFIMAILISLAATSLANPGPGYDLQRGVWEIQSRLNEARFKAIYKGMPVKITFRTGSYSMDVYDETSESWRRERLYFFQGIRVEANNSPIFYPTGTVSNLASIYVSNSRGKYKITLAISGRVRAIRM